MKYGIHKLKVSFTIIIGCAISFLVITALLTSCKKHFDEDNGNNGNPPESTPDNCVLKEPYIIYTNDPTSMWVAVHTTHQVAGGLEKVQIQWKHSYESNYSSLEDMSYHKFNIPFEYGEEHEDYYVWMKVYPHGTFNPGDQIDYKVTVTYDGDGDYAEYYGWFYTNDPNASSLTFYAISDTQEDGSECNCNDKNLGGGPKYFVHVMNSMAEDMDKDYSSRYRLILHCGDFNFNGPREYFYPQDNAWHRQFFGTNSNNCDDQNRDKVLWILAHTPVMASIGNHDYMWDQHSDRSSIRDYVAAYPYDMYWERDNNISIGNACNPNWDYKDHPEHLYYSFDYGPAHFISLSSFPADENDNSLYFGYDSPQVSWLVDDLAKNTKEWIFVFTHIPIVGGEAHAHNIPVFNACEPLFQTYGVDAVLQGHEHLYLRRHYNGIPYLILGGGGGFLMQYAQYHYDKFDDSKWFWTRFDILNNDSCLVYVQAAYDESGATSAEIDHFTIYNRLRK